MSNSTGRMFASRYLLDVQISSSLSTPVWRAMDTSLKRWVTITLLPAGDLRGTNLLTAAQAAAANSRRDVVAILDVIPKATIAAEGQAPQSEPFLGIVTEWLDGETLDRRLIRTGEVFPATDALSLTSMLANTLVHSHSQGIFHQRLRPHNVVFAEGQEVRLAGFGIDRALLGADPGDAADQDIKGLGDILFAMVTGAWPKGSVDALPAAPKSGALPSQLIGGVRETVDTIYRRTQNGSFGSMREVADALTVGVVENADDLQSRVTRLTASSVTWQGTDEDKDTRIKATLIAAAGVVILGWIGWQLLTSNFHKSDTPVAILGSPMPRVSSSASVTPSGPLEIMAITDYDPQGDGIENSAKIKLAIDGNKKTQWLTASYKSASMSGKSGVGLILDLGAPRPVTTVSVDFSSIGQTAEIYVTDDPKPDITTAQKLGEVTSAQSTSVVKSPRAISGRYVVVWLTPPLQVTPKGDYQGGIAEIKVGL